MNKLCRLLPPPLLTPPLLSCLCCPQPLPLCRRREKAERREQLKKEGKLLTGKAKEEAERRARAAQQFLKQAGLNPEERECGGAAAASCVSWEHVFVCLYVSVCEASDPPQLCA